MKDSSAWKNSFLDQARLEGDARVDRLLSNHLAPWKDSLEDPSNQENFRKIQELMSEVKSLKTNADSISTNDSSTDLKSPIQIAFHRFLQEAGDLPDWADFKKIERVEELFKEQGVLFCVLLFCSSLPEVYVLPDVAAALYSTGNLEKATEDRIRTTATMVLTILLRGGLESPTGGGRPLILKARFVHGIVRHLLLRQNAEDFKRQWEKNQRPGAVPRIPLNRPPRGMYEAVLANGWDPNHDGIPCNQEELTYTLLTFSFVFLRSLRRLNIAWSPEDEEAYLHFWNVMGHILGIEKDMMAETMTEAEALFEKLQRRGREKQVRQDFREPLGQALMTVIEKSVSLDIFKKFIPVLCAYLTSPATAKDLGLEKRMQFLPRLLFAGFARSVLGFDRVAKKHPLARFSVARLILRIVGYQLLYKILNDQNQPLDLPSHIRQQVNKTMQDWSDDPTAPTWLNRVEDLFTTGGSWNNSIRY